ncbi:hypothetical protein [Streptomyces sp. NPDC002491]
MSPREVARRQTSDAASISTSDPRQLELDEIQYESEEMLVARGAAYAKEWARIENHPTILLRNIATVVVALRKQHDDWLGRDGDYRKKVADMYQRAGVDEDRIKSAVRYHVNNLIRRHLTPRELRQLGLIPESALERQQDARATNQAIVNATRAVAEAERVPAQPAKKVSATRKIKGEAKADVVERSTAGLRVKASADHLRLATVARSLVDQMSTEVIDTDMVDGQRAKLDADLADMEKKIRSLRRHLKNSRSDA